MTVLNVRAAKAALRVWEVPSYECRRIHGESSLHALRDGIRVFRKIWSECPAICARYTDAMRPPLEAVHGLLPLPLSSVPVETAEVRSTGIPLAQDVVATQNGSPAPVVGNGTGNGFVGP